MRDPAQLYGAFPGDETLARCRADKWPAGQTPWDGARDREDTVRVKARHKMAAIFCKDCVLITACEEALSDMESVSIHVEGVMAGRYSDVRGYGQTYRQQKFRQSHCRFCGIVMRPQAPSREWDNRCRGITVQIARHAGEGLCEGCFPTISRKARTPAPTRQTPNHGFRAGWEAVA